MKYILIVSAIYPPEPVVSARLSADLYYTLKKKGKNVKVLHPEPTRPNGFHFEKDTKIGEDEIVTRSYTCPQSSLLGRFRESISFGRECAKYIKERHDEIACVYANVWPLGAQYYIVKTANKYNIRLAIHIQDIYPESFTNKLPSILGVPVKRIILPVDKYILQHSERVIAISEKMKTYLMATRKVKVKQISVVINWQDEQEFIDYRTHSQISNEKNRPFTFMYMGNIGPVAGVELLIEAFSKTKGENARLVIAGSGSMKEKLKEQASNYHNIEFWDVPNGKVPEIQAQADIMLLPIKKGAASSSIPSKLPAYMFSAKPIIGCMDEDSDTANAIKESGCGFVTVPENPQPLMEIMEKMTTIDMEELQRMGEKGLEYALDHFSKENNLRKLEAIIDEIEL